MRRERSSPYGYNAAGTGQSKEGSLLGLGGTSASVVRTAALAESQVVAPSDMIAMGDQYHGWIPAIGVGWMEMAGFGWPGLAWPGQPGLSQIPSHKNPN